MANGRVKVAILLAIVAVVAAGEEGHRFRRWVHQCKREFAPYSVANSSEPIWAVKKTITGLYDPRTHHAFRKSVVTIAKFEDAIIRDPKEAEKCMVDCLAWKMKWIVGRVHQINASKVFEDLASFTQKFNKMARHKQIDTSKLKPLVSTCIAASSQLGGKCEKGFELLRCVHTAIIESMYDVPATTTTPVPSSTAEAWPQTSEQPSGPERFEDNGAYRHPPRAVNMRGRYDRRFAPPPAMPLSAPPQPQPMAMMPPPPMGMGRAMPMQAVPMAQPLPVAGGPEPAMIAYGQRSGVVEVFGRRPRYGQPWRETM